MCSKNTWIIFNYSQRERERESEWEHSATRFCSLDIIIDTDTRDTPHTTTRTHAPVLGEDGHRQARAKKERERALLGEREIDFSIYKKKSKYIRLVHIFLFFFDYFIFVAANWQRNIIYVLFMIAGFSFNFHSHGDFRLAAVLFRPKETCLIYLTWPLGRIWPFHSIQLNKNTVANTLSFTV